MPVERPTLLELEDRIVGDVDTRLPTLFARIPQNPANVFCQAVAGLTHGAYGYIDEQMKQVLPTTATGLYLLAWGKLLGLTLRDASKAVVPVSIAVTGIPTTIPLGTTFRRSDGALYETLEEYEANANPFAFEVTAMEAGEASTVTNGTVLTMTTFISGLATTVTATADAFGEDEEDEETYRGRILEELRDTPQGGADADYVGWAKEVEGVGYAWVIESTPPYVQLRISSNDEADLAAPPELVTAVEDFILDLPYKRKKPVNAILVVESITVTPVNFEFSAISPNTQAVKDAVDAALTALLATEGVRQPGGILRRNAVIAAVQNTGVVTTFTLLTPAADLVYGPSQIPELGTTVYPA